MTHISRTRWLFTVGAVTRTLAILDGMDYDQVYNPNGHGRVYDPDSDEGTIIALLEEARNVWRPIWRSRRIRHVETDNEGKRIPPWEEDCVPDTDRSP